MKLDEIFDKLSNAKKNEFRSKYNISDLFLSDYDYDDFLVSPLEYNKKISCISTLEGYKKFAEVPTMSKIEEKETEGKGLKLLTPNNRLTRLRVLLVLIKSANNSYKL